MNGLSVEIKGLKELQHALDQLDKKKSKATLQKVASAGAKALKPYVVREAPRGATGKLKRSVSARKAKRNLPAAIVSPRPSVAFYRHFVIGGTKRGVSPNPFVARGYDDGESAAVKAMEDEIERFLRSL